MSYDFLILKPLRPIETPDDIVEDAIALQIPEEVVAALSGLLPALAWRRETDGGWFGSLQDGPDGWYEYRIDGKPDRIWRVATSHGAAGRLLIPAICRALGVIAFDGQAMRIIRGDGP